MSYLIGLTLWGLALWLASAGDDSMSGPWPKL